MKISELYSELDRIIPPSLSCNWDNDGLMCMPCDCELTDVLVALDINDKVIDKAIAVGAQLIVTHHPLIFKGLRSLVPENAVERYSIRLIKAGISVFSFHTRLDALDGGVNDALAEKLGLTDVEKFGSDAKQMGRIGSLCRELSLKELAVLIKKSIGSDSVVFDSSLSDIRLKRIALLGGSGGDEIMSAKNAGADAFLTGELSYHAFLDAYGNGIPVITAGHFYTEYPICNKLVNMIRGICPNVKVSEFNGNTSASV